MFVGGRVKPSVCESVAGAPHCSIVQSGLVLSYVYVISHPQKANRRLDLSLLELASDIFI